ncbi:MAG TPA: response regulator [Bacteroidota bacterium]|nr:response regulator [Bacteroidota bacterium]
MNSIRILVVDDHAPFRRMLADFLSSHGSVVVVGEATNGSDAVQKTDELRPDLVLMDLTMPGMSGFDATRAIKNKHPETKVVVLSSHSGEVYRTAALGSSADDYIEKSSMKHALCIVLEQELNRPLRVAI